MRALASLNKVPTLMADSRLPAHIVFLNEPQPFLCNSSYNLIFSSLQEMCKMLNLSGVGLPPRLDSMMKLLHVPPLKGIYPATVAAIVTCVKHTHVDWSTKHYLLEHRLHTTSNADSEVVRVCVYHPQLLHATTCSSIPKVGSRAL
jgi:hypothetical protein